MRREDPVEAVVDAPNNSTKANNDKSAIYKSTKGDLAELRSYVPLEYVTHRVKSRVIRITNKI